MKSCTRGKAVDVMDVIEQPQTDDLADAWDRPQQVKRDGVMLLGRLEASQCHVPKQAIVVVKQREADFNTLLYGGIGTPLGHAVAMRLIGDLLPQVGPIILAIGILAMRPHLRP